MIQKDGKTYLDSIEARESLSSWIQEDARVLRRELHDIKSQHGIEYV